MKLYCRSKTPATGPTDVLRGILPVDGALALSVTAGGYSSHSSSFFRFRSRSASCRARSRSA